MSDPLYKKELLRLAADAHAAGRLVRAHSTGHAHNPICGDKVVVDIVVEDGRIVDIAQETKACVLTQASASILGKTLKGAARRDVEDLRTALQAMLAAKGPVPATPFEDYAAFDAALAYPSRHTCVLLPLDAVLAALDDVSETREPDAIRPKG
ncbi:MAG TPA: iron-sulfur cluster assembly scaffold protein [Rhizomicrobium sp.]|nr:iron-sulfur cluster assembly scaffold protein [Rhizomicrobium sp.]